MGLWGYGAMLSNIGRIQHLEPEYLNPIALSMPGKKISLKKGSKDSGSTLWLCQNSYGKWS